MNNDIGKKSAWINKKGSCLMLSVVEDGLVTCSRHEAVGSALFCDTGVT